MTELDPTRLYRVRDGVYAPDLLVVAVELGTMLTETGFTDVEQRRPQDRSVVLARKPDIG
ncbi:MAG: hypothetical protein ACRDQ5_06230 [Sciscionella sp.]